MTVEQGSEVCVGVCVSKQALQPRGKSVRAPGQERTASGHCVWSAGGNGPGTVTEKRSKSSQDKIKRPSKAMLRTLDLLFLYLIL